MILGVGGSKLGAKIDPKSIKKWGQHGKASWHRFLIDFGGFWEPSWGRKSTKNRSKKASKKRWKNEAQQDGQKVAIKSYGAAGRTGSRPLGRVSPFKVRETPPPPRRALKSAAVSWLGLVLVLLVFALASPSLASHVLFWLPLGSVLRPNLAPQIHQILRKIDAKMPSHLDFLFWSIFAPNLDPPNPKNHWNYIGFISIFGFAAFST